MKKIAFIILLGMVTTTVTIGADNTPKTIEKVGKFESSQENTLLLPTNFAKQFILNPEDAEKIKGKTIYHIDLVYTAFKTSPSFNQERLNQERILQLKKELPQVKSDNPTWKLIEQEGARTSSDAKACFHGFVIHYGEDLNYENLSEFFEKFQTPPTNFTVNNKTGGTFKYQSGSTITLAPNAVTYKNGKQVKGEFQLKYREFRNPADIAFSGIPMTYDKGKTEYNFSSVGMYEIRAEQNGEQLSLCKPVTIDFNCTDQKEGVDFYQMDDNDSDWKKVGDVNFNKQNEEKVVSVQNQEEEGELVMEVFGNNIEWDIRQDKDGLKATFSKPAWKWINEIMEQDEELKDKVEIVNGKKRQLKLKGINGSDFTNHVLNMQMNNLVGSEINGTALPNDKRATLLAEGSTDKGHTYPNLVKGLNSSNFGVYNCDQIYRIGKAKTLAPTYVDTETGEKITNKHVACIIDLGYNGSFSFHPNNITCNAEGKNVVLLFTENKEVYFLSEKSFAELDLEKESRPVFEMVNMTDKLKSSNDLKNLLNI